MLLPYTHHPWTYQIGKKTVDEDQIAEFLRAVKGHQVKNRIHPPVYGWCFENVKFQQDKNRQQEQFIRSVNQQGETP